MKNKIYVGIKYKLLVDKMTNTTCLKINVMTKHYTNVLYYALFDYNIGR